ncbi:MAG: MMPL family transporter, partial [Sandaracinaceae bacterium]|nr:MMPL family transporter [Sandaracinaceae bacterium]
AYMVVRDIPLHAATTIVFSVAIGLAVDDTIHILARYREEIAAGRSRVSSTIRSLRSSGRAAVVSGMTIWIGYAALLFASFVPVRLFGELSLVALGSALVCEILVLPALLVLFGPGPDARRSPVRARTREVAAKAA